MTATKKIKMPNHGAMKVHGKILKGFCAWQAQVKAMGIEVEPARCGKERARAFDAVKACLSNTLMVERGSGEPLPSSQQRVALATRLAPLHIINYQARPCAAVAGYVAKAAAAVPAPVRSEASIAIAITPCDEPRDQRMVDWSAEMALLQLKKKKGVLHVVERSNDKPVAHGSVLARLRLASGPESGVRARVAEVDAVNVVGFELPPGWAEEAMQQLITTGLRGDYESDFHMRWHEHDERREEIKSIEFGWSAYPGDWPKQRDAQVAGVPYKLEAWLDARGEAWVERFLGPVLPRMWELCKGLYHGACERAADRTMAHLYGLCGTGWNKVTVGISNPTGMHYDDKNLFITATLIVGMHGLKGGSHVLLGVDLAAGVVVEECEAGTVIFGSYDRALHGNLATVAGTRLVVNAYCSALVVDRIS